MFARVFRAALFALLLATAALAVPPLKASDEPLLVDMLPEKVEVDSSFTGSTVILYGVKTQPGDIIVTLRGPDAPVVVRRKRQVAGIWINRDAVAFRDVPQYYALAASRPIEEIMDSETLDHNQIGTGHILLNTVWTRTEEDVNEFRDALRRDRAREDLYEPEIGNIVLIHDSLFRATLKLPANIPIGNYVAETILVDNAAVISRIETELRVEKSGVSAEIFNFARNEGALYGLIAIAAALVAGWVGGVAFRKN
jgi:uncharacterized protein (TIGR02186 family)